MSGCVPVSDAASICECSVEVIGGYRLRAMPADLRRGLADDVYRPEEVIAVYVAVGLEGVRPKQSEIDEFVAFLLANFPTGEDWLVETGARRKLRVLSRSEAKLDGRRRTGRWLSPSGAYVRLRELGYPAAR